MKVRDLIINCKMIKNYELKKNCDFIRICELIISCKVIKVFELIINCDLIRVCELIINCNLIRKYDLTKIYKASEDEFIIEKFPTKKLYH